MSADRSRTPDDGPYATRAPSRLAYILCRLRGHAWGAWIGAWPSRLVEHTRCARCGATRTRRRGLA